MIPEAVFWDCNGTISDDEQLGSDAYVLTLKDYGINPEIEPGGTMHTVGMIGNMIVIREKYGLTEDLAVLRKKWSDHYSLLLRYHVESQPGVRQALMLFERRGIPQFVVSSANSHHIEIILDRLDYRNFFRAVVTGELVKKPKPDPEIYLLAAQIARITRREDCLVIEDSGDGSLAARSANMKVLAVPNRFTKNQKHHAHKIISSLADLTWEMVLEL